MLYHEVLWRLSLFVFTFLLVRLLKTQGQGHSLLLLETSISLQDTLCQYLDQSPKGMDIIEIEESAPQLLPPPSPAPVVNSGYEKHFMPTWEEMQKLS